MSEEQVKVIPCEAVVNVDRGDVVVECVVVYGEALGDGGRMKSKNVGMKHMFDKNKLFRRLEWLCKSIDDARPINLYT